ncbi:MAG: glycoside hydrolase family 2 protein [Bacteroidales bacterium]|nr:glycoside hydrolase family 2 protein [Bacteroidales bacterium]
MNYSSHAIWTTLQKTGALVAMILMCLSCSKKPETVLLNSGWQFTQATKKEWRDAVVPGTVHQDLLRYKLIPDPTIGTNEKEIQWVENEDWIYQTQFEVSSSQLSRGDALLTFEGLDTYADVYLNDSLILRSDNMFVGYSLSVHDYLKKGTNHLRLYFHSPITFVMPQYEANGFEYPADNDHSEKHLSVYSRKAPYHFGWDWGLRMVTSGIWRPVSLTYYDVARIADFHVNQLAVDEKIATISNEITIHSLKNTWANVTVKATRNEQEIVASRPVRLVKGENKVTLPMEIRDPERWMPNGWGTPALYDFTASVSVLTQKVASQTERIGLRTIEVITEEDSNGESFYFKVNGKPMYAKGVNYIPTDLLLPRVTDSIYHRTFEDIQASNMNMVRVWGGGVYEDNRFYNEADEHGILVWQDFMFACTPYPTDSAFLSKVSAEADYNIRRLRNHACMAMWCGNNEILEALTYWGLQNTYHYSDSIMQGFTKGYNRLFRGLLPAKVMELDSNKYYVHGSPYVANWGKPELFAIRDVHDWGVWHGRMPFEAFEERKNRFSSEFGFQSFPEMKTIATFATPADYQLESEVMKVHQKSYIGNTAIRQYMEMYYQVPEKFEDFVYVGLVMQGMGMRMGFDAQRRNRPYCMGTVYWQLNDCWPVVSWSSIDFYGNWKALQYQAQRAFASPALSFKDNAGTLQCYVLTDTLMNMEAKCRFRLISFEGQVLSEEMINIPIPANASSLFAEYPVESLIKEDQKRNCCLEAVVTDLGGKELTRRLFFFCKPKEMQLPVPTIAKELTCEDGKYTLKLKSDKLVKDLFVEIPVQGARFSDNFFDLLPGEEKEVIITSPQLSASKKEQVTLHHLRQTYK